nr:MAG TPA: hypothetical protein [Caudoviricetes sp.]
MIEKKVYPSWAYTENQYEKRDINMKIYEELKEKYKINKYASENIEEYDIVFEFNGFGYANKSFKILSNKAGLSSDELALIADDGNLCFGYKRTGDIIKIYID